WRSRESQHRASDTVALMSSFDESAVVDDDDARRQSEHLIQVARIHDDGAAASRDVANVFVHTRRRANVQAARRILRHEHRWIVLELTRHHELLLIAARQGTNSRRGCAAAYVIRGDERARPLTLGTPANHAAVP